MKKLDICYFELKSLNKKENRKIKDIIFQVQFASNCIRIFTISRCWAVQDIFEISLFNTKRSGFSKLKGLHVQWLVSFSITSFRFLKLTKKLSQIGILAIKFLDTVEFYFGIHSRGHTCNTRFSNISNGKVISW